jgi:hypothetical protein
MRKREIEKNGEIKKRNYCKNINNGLSSSANMVA